MTPHARSLLDVAVVAQDVCSCSHLFSFLAGAWASVLVLAVCIVVAHSARVDVEMNKGALRTIIAAGLVMLLGLAFAQFVSSGWMKASAERWEFLMRQLRR
jgi:hypothetical protein